MFMLLRILGLKTVYSLPQCAVEILRDRFNKLSQYRTAARPGLGASLVIPASSLRPSTFGRPSTLRRCAPLSIVRVQVF